MSKNITRKRGDTYPIEWAIKSNGSALDITGALVWLTVDPSSAPVDNSNNLFSISGTVTNGPAGLIEFPISTPNADHLGDYFYDLQIKDTSGFIRTVEAGKFKFVQDITKAV